MYIKLFLRHFNSGPFFKNQVRNVLIEVVPCYKPGHYYYVSFTGISIICYM